MATIEVLNQFVFPHHEDYYKLVGFIELLGIDSDIYLTSNGQICTSSQLSDQNAVIHVNFRLRGGKGGFGSMLRSMGSRMGRSSNHESCRNLEGRRLRDVHNEQKIADWLASHPEKDKPEPKEDIKYKRLKKIVNKGDSKNSEADQIITEAYFKKIEVANDNITDAVSAGLKLKYTSSLDCKNVHKAKKVSKPGLKLMWGLEDLSDTDETQSDDEPDKCIKEDISVTAEVNSDQKPEQRTDQF